MRGLALLLLLLLAGAAQAADLELLHAWTSGSEAAMVGELKAAAQRGGVDLKTTAVAGASATPMRVAVGGWSPTSDSGSVHPASARRGTSSP